MPEVTLSPETVAAIDHDTKPHVVGSAAGVLLTLGSLFQLLVPVLIQVLQKFAASGTTPTAANVFQAGHELTADPAVHYAPDSQPSG
jgi:hypothetical protein